VWGRRAYLYGGGLLLLLLLLQLSVVVGRA
jgi:hypothetical protein